MKSIPTDWIGQLARKSDVDVLFQKFADMCEDTGMKMPDWISGFDHARHRIAGALCRPVARWARALGHALACPQRV